MAAALRDGRAVEPESYDCVTIFFSDIVGFTNISGILQPQEVSTFPLLLTSSAMHAVDFDPCSQTVNSTAANGADCLTSRVCLFLAKIAREYPVVQHLQCWLLYIPAVVLLDVHCRSWTCWTDCTDCLMS